MKKRYKINRRQFLTVASGFCAASILPYSIFNFFGHKVPIEYAPPIIKVVGVGSAGVFIINHMIDSRLQGVKFIVADTDSQFLDSSKAPVKLRLGKIVADTDTDPEIGRKAALESAEAIRNTLKDSQIVFILAGFGGGTGTGAAPVIADICKEIGILTVAVVTKPFSFEGRKRVVRAIEGISALEKAADTVIAIPADRIRSLIPKNAKMIIFIKTLDEIILKSVKHIYLGLLR